MEQHFEHQRALAGPRYAGHTGQQAERNLDGHALEIVFLRARRWTEHPFGFALAAEAADQLLAAQDTGPVSESGFAMTCFGVPWAMILPPCVPAPGPMSRIWSAACIVSASCSTTITVLPRSRRRSKVWSRRRLSR